MNIILTIPIADAEALTFFLAKRAALWRVHAQEFGCESPDTVPQQLATAYARAINRARTQPK